MAGFCFGFFIYSLPLLLSAYIKNENAKGYTTGATVLTVSCLNFAGFFSGFARKRAFRKLDKEQTSVKDSLAEVMVNLATFRTAVKAAIKYEEPLSDDVVNNEKNKLCRNLYALYDASQKQAGRGQTNHKIIQQDALHSMQIAFSSHINGQNSEAIKVLLDNAAKLLEEIRKPLLKPLISQIVDFRREYCNSMEDVGLNGQGPGG